MICRLVRKAYYASAFIDTGTLLEWALGLMDLPSQVDIDKMVAESFEFWHKDLVDNDPVWP